MAFRVSVPHMWPGTFHRSNNQHLLDPCPDMIPRRQPLSAGKWSTGDFKLSLRLLLGAGSCPGDPTLM